MQFVFDQPHAKDINEARLNHLASLGLKLENSTVLEVGAGIGLLTGFFEKLGCTILSTEARKTNVEEHRSRYPHRRVEVADLSKSGSHDRFGEFDIVFCYGTLYHLSNPALAIKDLSKACRAVLLLETCVCPIDNGGINSINETESALDQSFEGIGCRPARNWVLSELRKHFPYAYVAASQPDHPDFPLNWSVSQKNHLTRSVFVASNKPLDMPILLQDLPSDQYVSASLQSSIKFETQLPLKKTEGILFDNFRVSLDLRSTKVGGSWQGITRDGVPTAWDMETIKFFYDRTLEIENPVVLDIGANTGSFCLLAEINLNIKCLAFEPMPMIYEILKNNILLNKLQHNVKPLQIALSDKKGSAVLKYPKSGTDSGFACLGKPIRFDNWTEIEVPVNTLDQVAIEQGIKKVDLIKIDTEGCELLVLKGGENLIREYHPDILTEYYEANTQQFGYSTEKIRELLSSWGYDSKKISSEDMYFFRPKTKKVPLMNPETSTSDAIRNGGEDFYEWIVKLSTAQKRLYYHDQTPESLNDLVKLVDKYKPTKIVELGTLSGLSLRTWLSADTNAEIIAIDLSFAPLRQSQQIIPVDLSRVKLLEQDILKTDFSQLWGPEDRVLLYVDARDMPNVPIMDHVLQHAVPLLPEESVVVIDDVWRSETALNSENSLEFLKGVIIREIDHLQCFQGHYAPYWKGGSFFGFREVMPLMNWVNQNKVDLNFQVGIKSVAFEWKQQRPADSSFDAREFERLCGNIKYNPVENLYKEREVYTQGDQKVLALFKQGAELYATGKMDLAMACFKHAADLFSEMTGVFYAQGVILARSGKFEAALQVLEKEAANPSPHENAQNLQKDINTWIKNHKSPIGIEISPTRMAPISIFAMPKPFKGHIDIIQQNAIKSWTFLKPQPEIILLGDEEGTAEIAKKFGLRHIPHIARNAFGTPLLNSIFTVVEANSINSILAYVNADIILMGDFAEAIKTILSNRLDKFLMVGKRWDTDIRNLINFNDTRWEDNLKSLVNQRGTLHAETGVDYFVFPKGGWSNIPPFALGRTAWDNWLIQRAIDLKMHVIDATQATTIIHQNHDYGHIKGGIEEAWNGEEAKLNLALAGGYKNLKSIAYATWKIRNGVLIDKLSELKKKGEVLRERGGAKNTLAAFKKAIEIDPNIATAHNNLGILYWQAGETQNAIDQFENALKIDPNNRDAILNYGNVQAGLGKIEDIRNLYSTYLQANPQDKELLSALSELCENVHNSSPPQKAYDKLWKAKLNDPAWLKNDGKGRVEYCANFLNTNFKLNGNTKLLDVGCGRGTLALYLDSKISLYGIDISETAIAHTKKKYNQADQINLDEENLPYDNGFFDFVVALDVIEHVYDPLSLINKMQGVLKDDGKLILSTPNILYEKYLKDLVRTRKFPKTSGDDFPYDGGHIHFFTYQDLIDLMRKADLKTKSIGPYKHQFDYEFKEATVWILAEKM
jgi:FkbM family methyltransferase